MINEQALKKALLVGRKSDRIIFAVTPEMKEVVAKLAEENCTTVSGYITSLIVDDAIAQKETLFPANSSGPVAKTVSVIKLADEQRES